MDDFEYESILMLQRAGWETTLKTLWPDDHKYPFSQAQRKAWEYLFQIMPDTYYDPYIMVWARGSAKSTTAERATALLGALRRRKYCWYVSGTQSMADDHILSISEMLTSENMQKYFPSIANKNVDKEGVKEGWRRNRLITQAGFAIDALGIETAMRGKKLGAQRPDLIIIDDIDEQFDTPETTIKKQDALANKIIPAGTPDVVVIGAQNLITPKGMFSQFAFGTSPILKKAIINGPVPLIEDLQVEDGIIINGTSTWPEKFPIEKCQNLIDQIGVRSFMTEYQHDVHSVQGSLYTREHIHYKPLPEQIQDYNIGVDPAMSDSARADESGIYVGALGADGDLYVAESRSGRHHPSVTKQIAYDLWQKYQCEIWIEIDNGGQWLVDSLISMGIPTKQVVGVKSGGISKRGRAQPIADKASVNIENNHLWLCQKFEKLENQMVSWVPAENAKSPDHLDGMTWALSKWIQPRVQPARGYSSASLYT